MEEQIPQYSTLILTSSDAGSRTSSSLSWNCRGLTNTAARIFFCLGLLIGFAWLLVAGLRVRIRKDCSGRIYLPPLFFARGAVEIFSPLALHPYQSRYGHFTASPARTALKNSRLTCGDITIICEKVHQTSIWPVRLLQGGHWPYKMDRDFPDTRCTAKLRTPAPGLKQL